MRPPKNMTPVMLSLRRDVGLFRAFPEAALRELARKSEVRRFARAERLCHAGDPARSLWALLSGRVRVQRRHWNGRSVGIEIMVPGEVFGLPALTHWSYPSEIEAILDSRALVIPRAAMLEVMERNPAVARDVLSVIVKRLRCVEAQLFLAHEPVETRLAWTLAALSEKFGSRIPLTHGEIAEMASTTAETTMRRLKALAARGLIRRRRGEVVIADAAGLKALVPEA